MKFLKALISSLALAFLSTSVCFAQVYPITTPVYIPNAALAASTLSTTGDYVFNTAGVGTVNFQISGTCTALAATPQVSVDGTNWVAVNAYKAGTTKSALTSVASTGIFSMSVPGYNKARLHITALSAACTFSAVGGAVSMPSTPNAVLDPCQSADILKSSVAIAVTSATTTALVAASAGKAIYVCGFSSTLSGTTTPTMQFKYGTKVSTECDTGATILSGVYTGLSATSQTITGGGTVGSMFVTPVSQELCVTSGGTAPLVGGVLTYVQQ